MPPTVRYNREVILSAAFRLVRRSGPNALNARAVAREAGSSTQPIFRLYSGMDDLKNDVFAMAQEFCNSYFLEHTKNSELPLLDYGLTYILFARDEPELFKLLYMCDRSGMDTTKLNEDNIVIRSIQKITGYSLDKSRRMVHWLWIFTYGLAVSMATRYISYSEEDLRHLLINAFDMVQQRMNQYDE